MTDLSSAVDTILLAPSALSLGMLTDVMGKMLAPGVDLAEIYLEAARSESWSIEDSVVKSGAHAVSRGAGLRAVSGEKSGYAYADNMDFPALQQAANAARSIVRQGQTGSLALPTLQAAPTHLYLPQDPIDSLSEVQKVALLQQIDAYARSLDSRVTQVMASVSASHEVILILASDGTAVSDTRPLIRVNVSVIAEQNGRRESGYFGGGGRVDFATFLQGDRALEFAAEAVRQALINLEAIPAPAGLWPIILGAGWPGILLHEAIGHGLEGDFNRRGSSAFSNSVGQKVASEQCTIVDDGTLADRRGSLHIDDEGTPTQCTTLIENGMLKGYLQDKLNAHLMKTAVTGNGRRESYAHLPMPRMTNTYLLPGKHTPEEIIESVSNGIYAVNFSGGQVDITSGKFVFVASEAYLIENGKMTAPIKGATLIGNGPDVLTKVSMVGNNLELDEGVGVCGKDGQSVPVGVGQPTIKIDEMTVGGTN